MGLGAPCHLLCRSLWSLEQHLRALGVLSACTNPASAPCSLQEAGENAGPVQRPDEGSPAWGQSRPQEPSEVPALLRRLRCLTCSYPRTQHPVSGTAGGPLEGDLHLFETPWEATWMYYGLMALLCLEKDAGLPGTGMGVCVREQVICKEFSILINTLCSYPAQIPPLLPFRACITVLCLLSTFSGSFCRCRAASRRAHASISLDLEPEPSLLHWACLEAAGRSTVAQSSGAHVQ